MHIPPPKKSTFFSGRTITFNIQMQKIISTCNNRGEDRNVR